MTGAGPHSDAHDLAGRVALVTGAASGIGRATATALAAYGARVVVADLDEAGGARTVDAVRAAGGQARFVRVDVSERDQVRAAVHDAMTAYGALHIACNIAGRPSLRRALADVTDTDVDAELAVSLKGVLHGCQEAAAVMADHDGCAIVNIASTVVDIPTPEFGLYHLGKVASVSITRTLAHELGPRGIRVNAVAPGATLTEFSSRYFTREDGQVDEAAKSEWLARMSGYSPLGLVGAPEDQAAVIAFLVSPASRFVTGQVVRANGGWSMP